MPDLKVTMGTVNYTDWMHVTASKVSDPGVVVWETWINVPVTNYNFIIPNLEPANYYVRYYDAPTNVALGTLHAELVVNALTGETLFERRFYTVGGPNPIDPVSGGTTILDPYLIGKNITGLFKEGFRFLDDADEFTFNDTTGLITVTNGTVWGLDGEKVSIEIKYAVASTGSGGSSGGGLYTGTMTVTAATQTLLAADIGKRVRCKGSAATQVLTLPLLSSFANDVGFYFDNSVGGTAIQIRLLVAGTDRILYSGFKTPTYAGSIQLEEFWVDQGDKLLLRKYNDGVDTFWEVLNDWKGNNVGEKVSVGYKGHPGILTENGQLVDGDEYPKLWWWLNNILPANHKYVTDTVTGAFSPTLAVIGQFALHSTLKKFRMPTTIGLVEKGLANFETYSAGNYPGRREAGQVGQHDHFMFSTLDNGGSPHVAENHSTGGNLGYDMNGSTQAPTVMKTGLNIGSTSAENRVDSNGVIFGRRI